MRIDALLLGDLHLWDLTPECRKDNYFETALRKLAWVVEMANKWKCPILQAGDIFDRPNPPPRIINPVIGVLRHLSHPFDCVAGQHDLQNHSMENYKDSGLATLEAAGVVNCIWKRDDITLYGESIKGRCWGQELPTDAGILIMHKMMWSAPITPDQKPGQALRWINKHKEFAMLVVSGDNHASFAHRTDDGRLLVNPGSMMRMTGAQINHVPKVYAWDCKQNIVHQCPIPIFDVVTREHLDIAKARDSKKTAFVASLKEDVEVSHLFKNNLKQVVRTTKPEPGVVELVQQCTEAQDGCNGARNNSDDRKPATRSKAGGRPDADE